MTTLRATTNIADALFTRAVEAPERVALRWPDGRGPDGRTRFASLTYAQLARDVEAAAAGLLAIGIADGVRAVLMVKPGPAFYVLMYALFRARAVPVLIDPGIDRRALKQCLDEAEPHAFIGIPLAHAARIVLGWARRSNRINVTVGRRWFWGGHTYAKLLQAHRNAVGSYSNGDASDLAAILFTSGSTGIPKGVEYTHAIFAAQVRMIATAFDIAPGEVDVPTFAPFALFDPALGMTSVLPDMDYARPGRADPERVLDAIAADGASTLFGSPAVLDVLARHGEATGARLPTLLRVLSAGAPVRPEVVERFARMLPVQARIWTPYGSTECLPVAAIDGAEILAVGRAGTANGRGICVGRPLPDNLVRIIGTSDEAIPDWSDALVAPASAIGEITVAGPTTTARYFRRDAATALAKIRERLVDGGERIVHRMGDLGYLDTAGRLWYVGRKSHRVHTASSTLYPEMVEGILNTHPEVRRTALVGVGPRAAQVPVICVELHGDRGAPAWPRVLGELAEIAACHPLTAGLAHFLRHPAFPVDIRHNAKIGREKLAAWAAARVRE